MKTVHFFRKMILRTILLCGVVLLYTAYLQAQVPGTNDPSFNPGDVGLRSGFNGIVYSIVPKADGKILVGGNFINYNGIPVSNIVQLNEDGSIDTNFEIQLKPTTNITSIVLLPDGKILIGGYEMNFNGIIRKGIARLYPDGSLDTSFDLGTENFIGTSSVAVQSDSKLLVGGWFNKSRGSNRDYLARLHPDGSLDTSFSKTGFVNVVQALAIQSDGKILVGGFSGHLNGIRINGLARLNPDGDLDTTFHTYQSLYASASIYDIAIQEDEKILIGGYISSYDDTAVYNIARLQSSGYLDTSFNLESSLSSNVNDIELLPDGKIIAGLLGSYSLNNEEVRGIVKLNNDGSMDDSFNPGSGTNKGVEVIALQSDGDILLGGEFGLYDGQFRKRLARIHDNGVLDESFHTEPFTGFNDYVRTLVILEDDKILVGGDFTGFDNTLKEELLRLNRDGSLDNSFNPEIKRKDFKIQPDGKIVMIGADRITRLNKDGSFDLDITGFSGTVSAVAFQSDGKILVGGAFRSIFNEQNISTPRNKIARFNSDGSLDQSFVPEDGFDFWFVTEIITQSDGKILVGGLTDAIHKPLVRLNTDGTLDTSFNLDTIYSTSYPFIQRIVLQPDGKILIAGWFTELGGLVINNVKRFNPDGSLDMSFNPPLGSRFSPDILTLDGNKILVSVYSPENGHFKITRLNADGSFEAGFNSGEGFDTAVQALALQSDGKIIAGGNFTNLDGIPRNYIARLFGGEVISVDSLILVHADTDQDIMPLSEGAVINLSEIGTSNLSVRAVGSNNAIKSVKFNLSGAKIFSKTESMAPYTLFGDQNNGKDFLGQEFVPGSYSLTATPYNQAAAQGTAGTALSVNFSVIPGNALAVQQLILINANTDQDISPLTEGAVIDLGQVSTNNFSIRATTLPSSVGSVYFALSGPLNITRTENVAPYSLLGDQNGGKDFFGQNFAPGRYTLSVTPYSGASRTGNVGATRTIHFEVVPGNVLTVQDLILVNADTDQDLMPLSHGAIIDLSEIGTANLSVRATTSPYPVGSVRFHLSGALSENKVETAIPYTLFGDLNGGKDFIGKAFTPGQYSLTVTPYAKAFGNGTVGTATTLNFSVIQSESNALLMEVIIYPNTTSDWVTISLKNATEAQLKVIDRAGQTVYEGLVQDGSQVSFAGQSTGTYQMIFQANAQTLTKQVMVVR